MSESDKTKAEPWRLRFGRAKFLRPRLLLYVAGAYAVIFLLVAVVTYVLGWVAPRLPWLSKPYISPDPPPLLTAFYCANLVLGFMIVSVVVVYIVGPDRRIRRSRPKDITP